MILLSMLFIDAHQCRHVWRLQKELKKLAKAQMSGISQSGAVTAPTVSTPTVATTPSSSQLPASTARHSQPFPFASSGTPRPTGAATNGRNTRPSTPSNAPVANGSSVPRPGSVSTPSSMPFKGKKRELVDGGAYTDPSTPGSRNRPIKRPKTVGHVT